MNLIDLFHRKDKILKASGSFSIAVTKWGPDKWRSILVLDGRSSFSLSRICEVRRLKSFPREIGWYVGLRANGSGEYGEIRVTLQNGTEDIAVWKVPFGEIPVPIALPWPVDGRLITSETVLNVSFDVPNGRTADLFVHKALDRSCILNFATGAGIEIGPGPKPQVFQSEITSVQYLEEMPQDRWKELYDRNGKYGTETADFSKYIIGTADTIPAEPQSLDFIFSSHLFEHLANPLGHLARWHSLLKPGGVVLAVVPEMHSTKDICAMPSTLEELKQEMAGGLWRPTEHHYSRWLKLRGSARSINAVMDNNLSIHVHYYDSVSISMVLETAVSELGYTSYSIVHANNHKDFYFCLWK
ncbi:methyltransferase domain-containing protein [Roseibium polysiphoniae]|uniref:Methyltransferase domain-containing protein n=1 Tax=Roseibium polysiphoniae TaxID=2571221 RepID=A0A944CI99_9HYPH|nr:methyltransferase domain-containing protein [Roseibium polysiphoniae]MBS8262786.1 methyltransferase domain-containing protein [Roseibium polysiphoniae]